MPTIFMHHARPFPFQKRAQHQANFINMAVSKYFVNFRIVIMGALEYFVGAVVIFIFVPFLAILLTPIILLRRFLFHCAKFFRPDLGKMVTARGSLSLVQDPYVSARPKMVTGMVLEGRISLETLYDGVKSTIETIDPSSGEPLYPELTQSIENWMGYPFWKTITNFNLKDLITFCDNNTNNTPVDHREVVEIMKVISLKPFERDNPLWKLTVIPRFIPLSNSPYMKESISNSQYSFVIMEIHHALVDGFSLMKLFHKIFKVKQSIPSADSKQIKLNVLEKLITPVGFFVRAPYDVGERIVNAALRSWVGTEIDRTNEVQIKDLKPRDEESHSNARLPFSVRVSDLMPFSDIKEVRHRHNVTALAVISAAIAGSIRKVLFMKANSQKKRGNHMKFGVVLELPGHPDKLRNHMYGTL
jgi:hypothetical protein